MTKPSPQPQLKNPDDRPREGERPVSGDFRHCRPKRDWGNSPPADR